MSPVTRRDVVKAAAGGTLTLGAGLALERDRDLTGQAVVVGAEAVAATPGVLDLYVNEGFVPMVDGALVYMRGFGGSPTDVTSTTPSLWVSPQVFLADGRLVASRTYPLDAVVPPRGRPLPAGPHPTLGGESLIRRAYWASFFPQRTIVAESGSTVRVRVHNRLRDAHELSFGTDVARTGPIAPGTSVDLSFPAPAPGTYLYQDPGNAPVERVLGLHGVLVVVPAAFPWRLSSTEGEFERQWIWLCQDVDPVWASRAHAGEVIDPVSTPAVPRYFMLNDRSGFASLAVTEDDGANRAAEEETLPNGTPRPTDVRDFSAPDGQGSIATGQLIRMVNAGLVIHQMHFHGNHVWKLRKNGVDYPRAVGRFDQEGHLVLQNWEDVVELDPLQRSEVMLPVRRPPDVVEEVWKARRVAWHYPMHCHAEPSQTAAGGLYPGGLVADWTLSTLAADGGEAPHLHYPSQVAFSSNMPKEGSPTTEFLQRPDRFFLRKFYNRQLTFPDGAQHEIWSFEDETGVRRFPAPLIRATEGDLVHTRLEPSKRVHTIHHHGIEPDPRNDGVGHTSFEVTGSYTYQWRPPVSAPGDVNHSSAGTYFYHCHVNTVLHVQMGMAGLLLVDPAVHPDFPVPPGGRRAFVDGPAYDIATEAVVASFAVDPRWHELSHAAGLSGEDVGLNRFEPTHFYVLGGALAGPPGRGDVDSPTQLRVNVDVGGRLPTLLRMVNLTYVPTHARFTTLTGEAVAIAELIANDARPLRDTSRPGQPSPPLRDAGNPVTTSRIAFGAAERYDVLLHPPSAGTYLLQLEWADWRTEAVMATRTVRLVAG